MKKIFLMIILTGTGICSVVDGQSPGNNTTEVLGMLFSRLAAANKDRDRLAINDSIKFIIDNYSVSDTVFTHKFAGLKYLGQITSNNSQLKILNWNLLLKEAKSRYYCYLVHRSGKKNMVYKLEGTYNEEPIWTNAVYSDKNWYGALYYDLRAFRKDNQIYWILLGIDYGNPLITRKIIDVLSFTAEGGIIFGKEIFVSGDGTKYREVLEYSSGAVISLKFISDKSIVFDHLVPVSPELKGQKQYYGPDFSYDAYYLEKGMWRLKTNVDARNKN